MVELEDDNCVLNFNKNDNSSFIAEFSYLNDMNKMRINTAHYVWFGSIVSYGAIISIGLQYKSKFLLCISIILMIPFVLSISFQLKCVTKIRTYISVFICPVLDISYDKQWKSITGAINSSPGVLGLRGLTYILLMPYFFYSLSSFILAININTNIDDLLSIDNTSNFLDNFINNRRILLLWLFSNLLFLFSGKVMENSHSGNKWDRYTKEWEARKESENHLEFKDRIYKHY